MPLNPTQLQARINSGKPFIVGQYLGAQPQEMLCSVKDSKGRKTEAKENRVFIKHTVVNANGIHVYSEWLDQGARLEKDKTGVVTRVLLRDGTVKESQLKPMTEVVVDLFKYARDGVGMDIMGDVHPIT